MTTLERQKFLMTIAKSCVRKVKGGLVVYCPEQSVSFVSLPNSNVITLIVEPSGEKYSLIALSPDGRTFVASGSQEEMSYLKEAIWELLKGDRHATIALCYMFIGLMVGIIISATSMFIVNNENAALVNGAFSTPAKPVALGNTNPAPVISNFPVANYASPINPAPAVSPPLSVSPANSKPPVKSLNSIIQVMMEQNPKQANETINTIKEIGNYVGKNEPVPEEIIEKLPPDVLHQMIDEALAAGASMPRIKPKGSASNTSLSPANGVPETSTSFPHSNVTTLTPTPTPTEVLSQPLPLTWGGNNGEGVARDKNGIPTVPEKNSSAARANGSIELPGVGGGNLDSTKELQSFGLPLK